MPERDYPIGHPAASDYKGQKYTPPRAPWQDDFPEEHPARGGANTSPSDTPDGMRAAHLERERQVQATVTQGASDTAHQEDFKRGDSEAILMQQAVDYLRSRGYTPEAGEGIIRQYGIDAVLADKAAAEQQ